MINLNFLEAWDELREANRISFEVGDNKWYNFGEMIVGINAGDSSQKTGVNNVRRWLDSEKSRDHATQKSSTLARRAKEIEATEDFLKWVSSAKLSASKINPSDKANIGPGIYRIRNIVTNQEYIGQATNLYGRLKEHYQRSYGDSSKGNYHEYMSTLHRSIREYGPQKFEYQILCMINEFSDDDDLHEKLNDAEIHFIEKFNTFNIMIITSPEEANYNRNSGGQRFNHRKEYRRIQSNEMINAIRHVLKSAYDNNEKLYAEQVANQFRCDVQIINKINYNKSPYNMNNMQLKHTFAYFNDIGCLYPFKINYYRSNEDNSIYVIDLYKPGSKNNTLIGTFASFSALDKTLHELGFQININRVRELAADKSNGDVIHLENKQSKSTAYNYGYLLKIRTPVPGELSKILKHENDLRQSNAITTAEDDLFETIVYVKDHDSNRDVDISRCYSTKALAAWITSAFERHEFYLAKISNIKLVRDDGRKPIGHSWSKVNVNRTQFNEIIKREDLEVKTALTNSDMFKVYDLIELESYSTGNAGKERRERAKEHGQNVGTFFRMNEISAFFNKEYSSEVSDVKASDLNYYVNPSSVKYQQAFSRIGDKKFIFNERYVSYEDLLKVIQDNFSHGWMTNNDHSLFNEWLSLLHDLRSHRARAH